MQEPAAQDRRFGGIARLYTATGAQAIARAHVVIVGLGGVGSWAAEALARSGIGALTLVDLDHIALSNINRQIHACDASLGQAKVQAMQERIASYHPQCRVHAIEAFVDAQNWPQLLTQPADLLIDACDQMAAKETLALWALRTRTPSICAGAAGGKTQAHHTAIADLAHTTHDPLLAQLRYRLRKHHAAPRPGRPIGLPCVYSTQAMRKPAACAGAAPQGLSCQGYGSSVAVTANFGLCAAAWALDALSHTPLHHACHEHAAS